jgi:hypothetical protein
MEAKIVRGFSSIFKRKTSFLGRVFCPAWAMFQKRLARQWLHFTCLTRPKCLTLIPF